MGELAFSMPRRSPPTADRHLRAFMAARGLSRSLYLLVAWQMTPAMTRASVARDLDGNPRLASTRDLGRMLDCTCASARDGQLSAATYARHPYREFVMAVLLG